MFKRVDLNKSEKNVNFGFKCTFWGQCLMFIVLGIYDFDIMMIYD